MWIMHSVADVREQILFTMLNVSKEGYLEKCYPEQVQVLNCWFYEDQTFFRQIWLNTTDLQTDLNCPIFTFWMSFPSHFLFNFVSLPLIYTLPRAERLLSIYFSLFFFPFFFLAVSWTENTDCKSRTIRRPGTETNEPLRSFCQSPWTPHGSKRLLHEL